ncbi:hypothetical protein QYE76_005386 [Lolium multiflorum]|uniref:F-box domain-containing protein n=1 Tax=Lolium multiflorum TaxID=4521 RepID=A0AAD8RSJ7_LOLMU|nr:hypothetical protein QYE76_005386 [Lolium multiflorum]
MSRHLSSPVPVPPLEDDDILEEILLRLPPQPSSLPRASLVSKIWRSIVSNPQFLGRFRKHHRKQPLLGFFSGHVNKTPIFTPALDSPDRIPAARFPVPHGRAHHEYWRFMGCRHGLAVLINDYQHEVIVWDPLTGRQHRVPFPLSRFHNNEKGSTWRWRATVLCADTKDGHVHGDCFLSPFKLVLVCNGYMQSSMQSFACLYESVSAVWGNIVSTVTTHEIHPICPNILVGNALYWSLWAGDSLVFDTKKQTLGVIQKPADARITDIRSFQLLRTSDDNGLGLAKSIQLEGLFPPGEPYIYKEVRVAGYDEDSNVIVLSTYVGDFMLQLDLTRFGAMPCLGVMPMGGVPLAWTSRVRRLELVMLPVAAARRCLLLGGSTTALPPISSPYVGALPPPLFAPSRRHGGGRWVADLEAGAWGMVREALQRSSSTKDRVADVILGQQRPLRDVVFGWHHIIFFLQAVVPMRRIFGLSAALHADGDPSGVVPGVDDGGRASRPWQSCGGEEAPDCVFRFLVEVFLVKSRDCFLVTIFVRVFFVNCPTA